MDKIYGSDLDLALSDNLNKAYLKFVESFTPVLDEAEKYEQNITAMKLFADVDDLSVKEEIVKEMVITLTSFIPLMVKFTSLQDHMKEIENG
jgi:hypothetical protein